jgi:hypothetical protein
MYDYALVERSFQLKAQGLSDFTIAQKLGVSIRSVRHWRYGTRQRLPPEQRVYGLSHNRCPRCWGTAILKQPYSYLLGLYLGDGHIIDKPRQHTLSISCADAWPGLIDAAQNAMSAVMPDAKTGRVQRKGCQEVKSYSSHWTCLFPQHGPGRKHERAIILEPWQQQIVNEFPREFIRGLIHSDGCRVMNWTSKIIAGELKRYDYSRYHFTNESTHIRDLYTDTLDKLAIEWRYNNRNCISVAKRASVAALDEFVGPKY